MKEELSVTLTALRTGGASSETRVLRPRTTASAVYRPGAPSCETSLRYLEELFGVESRAAVGSGGVNHAVVLEWKTASISPWNHSTTVLVDNSTKDYIIFNRAGLGPMPCRIRAWRIMEHLIDKLVSVTILYCHQDQTLSEKDMATRVISIPPGSRPMRSAVATAATTFQMGPADNTRGNPISVPDCRDRNIGRGLHLDFYPYFPSVLENHGSPQGQEPPVSPYQYQYQHGYAEIHHRQPSHNAGKEMMRFDHDVMSPEPVIKTSPLVREENQLRNTCSGSSNQRAGKRPSAGPNSQPPEHAEVESSDSLGGNESDEYDGYWKWDREQQQFRHYDDAAQEWIICPETFD